MDSADQLVDQFASRDPPEVAAKALLAVESKVALGLEPGMGLHGHLFCETKTKNISVCLNCVYMGVS